MNNIDKSYQDKIFDVLNILFMIFIIIITLYPLWFAIVGSFNNGEDYSRGGVNFWPRQFTFDNYKVVFANPEIVSAFKVTVARTIIGTFTSVLFTAMFAFGYSNKKLIGRNFYAIIALITMYFGGGLIPYYLLITGLHLRDSFLVYIIPCLFNFFNVIIIQAFFREIPQALLESARIDGAGEYKIFFKIIIPLSMPVLATIALFNGVFHWNSYFDSMIFTSKPSLQTIQLLLMKVVKSQTGADTLKALLGVSGAKYKRTSPLTIQLATSIVATVPILFSYPFLQRYFISGIMIGSIKG